MKSALCLSFSFALFALPTAHAAHLAGNAVDWNGRQVSPTVSSRVFRQVCVNNNGEVAYVANVAPTITTSNIKVDVLRSTGGLGRTGTPAGTYEVFTPAFFPLVPGTVGVAGLDHFYLNNDGTLSVTGQRAISGFPYFIRMGSTEVLQTGGASFPAQMNPRSPNPSTAAALTNFSTSSFNCAFAEGTVVASITTSGSTNLMYRSLSGSNWVRANAPASDMMNFVAAGKNDSFLGLLANSNIGSKVVLFGKGLDTVTSPPAGGGFSYTQGVVSSATRGNSAFVTGSTLVKCSASGDTFILARAGQAIAGTTQTMWSNRTDIFGQLAMDTNGSLVYEALISSGGGPMARGLFRSARVLTVSALLLKTGATAPGVTNYFVDGINGMALADSGRLLVHATLKYSGTPPANVPALKEVLYDTASSTGALRLFAEAGDTVTVNGQTKTITGFELGNVSNRGVTISGLPINDSGMVACVLKFTNDRAVFVFDAK